MVNNPKYFHLRIKNEPHTQGIRSQDNDLRSKRNHTTLFESKYEIDITLTVAYFSLHDMNPDFAHLPSTVNVVYRLYIIAFKNVRPGFNEDYSHFVLHH